MKKTILGAAIGVALAVATDGAWAQQTYGDVARVLSATPIHERVREPRRDCRIEKITAYERREAPAEYRETSGAGTILGAIVGGVIGHQFGNTRGGRDHGTAAGAILGGIAGNAIERHSEDADRMAAPHGAPVEREVERCGTVMESRERIVGYDVRYEYNGREFRARMPYDPGPQIAVNVEVRPPVAPMPYGRAPYRGTF